MVEAGKLKIQFGHIMPQQVFAAVVQINPCLYTGFKILKPSGMIKIGSCR